jgi:hypothetical protein
MIKFRRLKPAATLIFIVVLNFVNFVNFVNFINFINFINSFSALLFPDHTKINDRLDRFLHILN